MDSQKNTGNTAGKEKGGARGAIAAIATLALLVAALIVWWDRRPEATSEEDAPPPEVTPELLARGETIFAKQCAACHGDKGNGDGHAAFLLYPKPRNFALGRFRLISTENRVPTDRDLFTTITNGMPGSAMPPWSYLSVQDRWALVFHVRRLSREGKIESLVAGDGLGPAEAAKVADELLAVGPTVNPGEEIPVTPEALAHGRELYVQHCASCHDLDGRGRKKRDLVDDEGFPVFARDYTQGVFKGGSDSKSIAYRMLAGMPGTPMPSYKETLGKNPADFWAVVHYIQSLVPVSAKERVIQRQHVLVAKKSSQPVIPDAKNPVWSEAEPVYLALAPLWWRDDRVEGLTVRVLHDGEKIGFLLSWEDLTKEDQTVQATAFADGSAIQFWEGEDPPFFAMGAKGGKVNIWNCKSHWQTDLTGYKDILDAYPNAAVDLYPSQKDFHPGVRPGKEDLTAKDMDPTYMTAWGSGNPVSDPEKSWGIENLTAQGFGTLESQPHAAQTVVGKLQWADGYWRVACVRSLKGAAEGDVNFTPGRTMSVAFAVWDGKAGDRNGQKSVTIWHRLSIEE
ncbi:MAG: c-type cytochrome [Planctomycetes bacterium]|nr:c-type cytochrome [Planctomycetota bacterium]